MKKLMIAALVAAIAGGASAADYVYDFSATVKTTKSKFGKTTTKIQLGVDNTKTNFWYEHPSVTNFLNATKKVTSKITVPTIDFDKLSGTELSDAIDAVKALWNGGNGTYNNKSDGKWCAEWTLEYEDCYRVTGTAKFATKLEIGDCCSTEWDFTMGGDSVYAGTTNTQTVIGKPLYQWFGSLNPDKATKVEMYANVNLGGGLDFVGALAGQGTRAKKNDKWYLSTISGNIVGTMPAPMCENCCIKPIPSVAFDCANQAEGAELPFTAAYGTFRMKINTKESTF